MAAVKNGKKLVCGSQSGVLSIWSWGYWNDCSDRFPGWHRVARLHAIELVHQFSGLWVWTSRHSDWPLWGTRGSWCLAAARCKTSQDKTRRARMGHGPGGSPRPWSAAHHTGLHVRCGACYDFTSPASCSGMRGGPACAVLPLLSGPGVGPLQLRGLRMNILACLAPSSKRVGAAGRPMAPMPDSRQPVSGGGTL